jgi:hypothetical protein
MRLETDKRLTRNEVRVVELQTSHCEAQDELIKQVLSIPALTPGRRSGEVSVLLNFVMPEGWREQDKDADYDVKQTRNFMIELIGGETAGQLREQFAYHADLAEPDGSRRQVSLFCLNFTNEILRLR